MEHRFSRPVTYGIERAFESEDIKKGVVGQLQVAMNCVTSISSPSFGELIRSTETNLRWKIARLTARPHAFKVFHKKFKEVKPCQKGG